LRQKHKELILFFESEKKSIVLRSYINEIKQEKPNGTEWTPILLRDANIFTNGKYFRFRLSGHRSVANIQEGTFLCR